jgi:hypothetical protein
MVVDLGAETPSHVVARADQIGRHYDQLTQRSSSIAFGGYADDVAWLKARLSL